MPGIFPKKPLLKTTGANDLGTEIDPNILLSAVFHFIVTGIWGQYFSPLYAHI